MLLLLLFSRTANCKRGRRIIGICRATEEFLSNSEIFKKLGIRIKVVGSSVEGTKICILDEADCMILFDGLKEEYFELTESATKYRVVTVEGKNVLERFMDTEGNLDYFKFLELLLTELERFLKESAVWLEGDICLPAVTFIKAGPCIIL